MIYVFKPIGREGPIKIGNSEMPESRMANYQLWSPYPLEMIAMIPGGFMEERYIHARFASHRLHGEWFEAAPELADFLDECAARGVVIEAQDDATISPVARLALFRELRGKGLTLQAIGDMHGLTRERVRQILASHDMKLTASGRFKLSEDYNRRLDDITVRMRRHSIRAGGVAERAGLTRNIISTWRYGRARPSEQALVKIEKALDAIERERSS